jgi:hypothetical protein
MPAVCACLSAAAPESGLVETELEPQLITRDPATAKPTPTTTIPSRLSPKGRRIVAVIST